MRIPFTKVYRAFPEFDSLSDEDCARYVRQVKAHRRGLVQVLPAIITLVLVIGWPVGWLAALWYDPGAVMRNVPMPATPEGRAVLLLVTSVMVPAIVGLLVRDFGMWLGLRDEVIRARCPRCKQSLLGVPIQEV